MSIPESNAWLYEEFHAAWARDRAAVSPAWAEHFAQLAALAAIPAPQPRNTPPQHLETAAPPGPLTAASPAVPSGAEALKGPALALARNMEASLSVPTATSVRTVEVSILDAMRASLNARPNARKTTFGHIITFAVVRAAVSSQMLRTFHAAHVLPHEHVSIGIAVDVEGSLVVPVLKNADLLDFAAFAAAYDDLVARATSRTLTLSDLTGAVISLTNPGGLGTTLSVPRLMANQAAIIGVGAIAPPPGFSSHSSDALASLGISKVCTLTSTYDHRVIQGATSGRFLRLVDELLSGSHGFPSLLGLPNDWVAPLSTHHTTPSASSPALGQSSKPGETPQSPSAEADEALLAYERAWFEHGHLVAHLDPLSPTSAVPDYLTTDFHGISAPAALARASHIRALYGQHCAIQASHLAPSEQAWLKEHFESTSTSSEDLSNAARLASRAEAFEQFLARKYVGQKRFGLEGLESLIPLLDVLVVSSPRVFIGMPHRGRLNVLCHIAGKPYEEVLAGFEGLASNPSFGAGDVKYHLGWTGLHEGSLVTISENPSHLETVAPVVCGMARGHHDDTGEDALAIVIHGDASAPGQGVAYETFALSGLDAYDNRGVIHVIADNHVGFTTSPSSSRAQIHPSDVFRGFDVPVFHANADDLTAVIRTARVAIAWRETFKRDCVIRLSGYRRNGHNEGDDASFTQPLEHALIQQHPTIGEILKLSDLPSDAASATQELSSALESVRAPRTAPAIAPATLPPQDFPPRPATLEELTLVRNALDTVPDGFSLHPKLRKQLSQRSAMLDSGLVDWATAELFALGVVASRRVPVRLVGEDVRRGTFSQRHASWVDTLSARQHVPLGALGEFSVHDSLLSEYAALGFEYGYQLQRAHALVLWEAQFGDFSNVAQVVIDQYLASAEDKWGRNNSLVLMLPHGFEGQGPEHSSARIERFLQLAANGSMRICTPTTSAQWFHLLCSHAASSPRRPLIVFTPKQPLRMQQTRSHIDELVSGAFLPVLKDPTPPISRERLVLCSGKIFWDLLGRRDTTSSNTEILRLEQLHPFPADVFDLVSDFLAAHPSSDVVWAQEEPLNQGPWRYVQSQFADRGLLLTALGRAPRSSPATGLKYVHDAELELIVSKAII